MKIEKKPLLATYQIYIYLYNFNLDLPSEVCLGLPHLLCNWWVPDLDLDLKSVPVQSEERKMFCLENLL